MIRRDMRTKLGVLRKLICEALTGMSESAELLALLDPQGNKKDREDARAYIVSLSREAQHNLMRPEVIEAYPDLPSKIVACKGLSYMQNIVFMLCVSDPSVYDRLPEKYRSNVPFVMANRGSAFLDALFMNDVANVAQLTKSVLTDPNVSTEDKRAWNEKLSSSETFRRLIPSMR